MSGRGSFRRVSAKPGQIVARYGIEFRGQKPEVMYAWGGSGADKSDSRIVMRALEEQPITKGKTLIEELISRGYDITTLRFSIERPRPTTPTNTDTGEGA